MKNLNFLIALLLLCSTTQAQNSETPNAPLVTRGKCKGADDLYIQSRESPERIAHLQRQMAQVNSKGPEGVLTPGSTGEDYDVKYHRLELRLNPDSSVKYVRGKVTTYFTTQNANFSIAKFDLASPLVCDSVYYHGIKLIASKISKVGDILQVTLPTISIAGTLDSLSIFYKGVPPVVSDLGGSLGFNWLYRGPSNNRNYYIYTVSESYGAYTWWPCKNRSTNDKADSVDIIISNPTRFKTAANGILMSETTVGSSVVSYWKHRYPISTYQVSIAVADYEQYPTTATMVNINGTSMPYYNLLFPETNTATSRANLDLTPLMLTTYSDKFGDYPFKTEKYGHYTFGPSVGGMEHNTFSGMSASTYNSTNKWDVIAHELGHQWFGASITCGSWSDLWLNESFATYAEIVTAEFAPATAPGTTAFSWRDGMKSKVMNAFYQARAVSAPDTSTTGALFGQSVYVYDRGAMVLSMLRSLTGDAIFFQALKNYQADPLLKYSTALTADFKRHMEAASGLDLATFFTQWIYNKGVASYSTSKWNSNGKTVILQLNQTIPYTTPVTHFEMPVEITIYGAGVDTTIIAYDKNGILYYDNTGSLYSANGNILQYQLSFNPTSVSFDPLSKVLAYGAFTKDVGLIVLAENHVDFSGKKSGADVQLSWKTEDVSDITKFVVEKSEDGRAFGKIAQVNAGDYITAYSFSFTDPNVKQGILYYRIKVIQQNGSFIYTKTISINSQYAENDFTISPNPAKDFIVISASKDINTAVSVRLFDVAGRLIKKEYNKIFGADKSLRINLDNVKPGTYLVEINSHPGKTSKKIVIIK
ncbi:MAG: M1 family aminopeptidase [Ferruginibacter sp.]